MNCIVLAWGKASDAMIAVQAGKLFDGTGANPVRNGVVLIDKDKIVGCDPADQLSIPEDIERY